MVDQTILTLIRFEHPQRLNKPVNRTMLLEELEQGFT